MMGTRKSTLVLKRRIAALPPAIPSPPISERQLRFMAPASISSGSTEPPHPATATLTRGDLELSHGAPQEGATVTPPPDSPRKTSAMAPPRGRHRLAPRLSRCPFCAPRLLGVGISFKPKVKQGGPAPDRSSMASPPPPPPLPPPPPCEMVEMELAAAQALAHLADAAVTEGGGEGSNLRKRIKSESPPRVQHRSVHFRDQEVRALLFSIPVILYLRARAPVARSG